MALYGSLLLVFCTRPGQPKSWNDTSVGFPSGATEKSEGTPRERAVKPVFYQGRDVDGFVELGLTCPTKRTKQWCRSKFFTFSQLTATSLDVNLKFVQALGTALWPSLSLLVASGCARLFGVAARSHDGFIPSYDNFTLPRHCALYN